jgi:aminoglycoside 2'-N-acetyltransferase I
VTDLVLRLDPTAALPPADRRALRDLLDVAYEHDFADTDWDHALGGVHARAFLAGDLVGHASVVTRRLLHGGRALRAGYVEAVAVRPEVQRRRIGRALMGALDPVLDTFDLGALSTSDAGMPLYVALGWLPWTGALFVHTGRGPLRTADDEGSVLVRPGPAALDLGGDLVADWRPGDVW